MSPKSGRSDVSISDPVPEKVRQRKAKVKGNVSELFFVKSDGGFRKVPSAAKKFTISNTHDQWINISPHSGVNKLKKTWENVIHSEFKRKNPSCVLHFTYQHVLVPGSRKINAPLFNFACCLQILHLSGKVHY
jgi:hypothetical protein